MEISSVSSRLLVSGRIMSTLTSSFGSCQLKKLYRRSQTRSDSCVKETCSLTSIPIAKHGYCSTTKYSTFLITVNKGGRRNGAIKMNVNPVDRVPQAERPNIPSPSSSSIGWSSIANIIPVILPFFKNQVGPLIGMKQKFDTAIATVAIVTEQVLVISTKAEKMLDEAVHKLPQDSWIRKVFEVTGVCFQGAIKAADFVKEIFLKVDNVIKEQLEGTNSEVDQERPIK